MNFLTFTLTVDPERITKSTILDLFSTYYVQQSFSLKDNPCSEVGYPTTRKCEHWTIDALLEDRTPETYAYKILVYTKKYPDGALLGSIRIRVDLKYHTRLDDVLYYEVKNFLYSK